jgi:hypothetical protein
VTASSLKFFPGCKSMTQLKLCRGIRSHNRLGPFSAASAAAPLRDMRTD